jgi:hypothetical protein
MARRQTMLGTTTLDGKTTSIVKTESLQSRIPFRVAVPCGARVHQPAPLHWSSALWEPLVHACDRGLPFLASAADHINLVQCTTKNLALRGPGPSRADPNQSATSCTVIDFLFVPCRRFVEMQDPEAFAKAGGNAVAVPDGGSVRSARTARSADSRSRFSSASRDRYTR